MKHFILFIFMTIFISGHCQNSIQYTIANTIYLKGNDNFWDYLTIDSNGYLYVSHGSMVHIVDTKQGETRPKMKSGSFMVLEVAPRF